MCLTRKPTTAVMVVQIVLAGARQLGEANFSRGVHSSLDLAHSIRVLSGNNDMYGQGGYMTCLLALESVITIVGAHGCNLTDVDDGDGGEAVDLERPEGLGNQREMENP